MPNPPLTLPFVDRQLVKKALNTASELEMARTIDQLTTGTITAISAATPKALVKTAVSLLPLAQFAKAKAALAYSSDARLEAETKAARVKLYASSLINQQKATG